MDLNADDLQTVWFPERPGGGDKRFGRFAPSTMITHLKTQLEANQGWGRRKLVSGALSNRGEAGAAQTGATKGSTSSVSGEWAHAGLAD